jgi:hypothetical protein
MPTRKVLPSLCQFQRNVQNTEWHYVQIPYIEFYEDQTVSVKTGIKIYSPSLTKI